MAINFERTDNHVDSFEHLWGAFARSKSLRTVTIISQNYDAETIADQVRVLPFGESDTLIN